VVNFLWLSGKLLRGYLQLKNR